MSLGLLNFARGSLLLTVCSAPLGFGEQLLRLVGRRPDPGGPQLVGYRARLQGPTAGGVQGQTSGPNGWSGYRDRPQGTHADGGAGNDPMGHHPDRALHPKKWASLQSSSHAAPRTQPPAAPVNTHLLCFRHHLSLFIHFGGLNECFLLFPANTSSTFLHVLNIHSCKGTKTHIVIYYLGHFSSDKTETPHLKGPSTFYFH